MAAALLKIGAFRVDVGTKIAGVESKILPELHDWQTVLGVWPHVLVDPRHRDLQESGCILRGQEGVIAWVDPWG